MTKIAPLVLIGTLFLLCRLAHAQTNPALEVPPAFGDVQIASIAPNDDSAKITISPYFGMVDMRIINVARPAKMKYSGGSLSIEASGINTVSGADFYIEILDGLGPFDTTLSMDPMMVMNINGQGRPDANPNVIARSDVFHVDCVPISLTGSQVFFDNFRNSLPLVPTPTSSLNTNIRNLHHIGSQYLYQVFENDKWKINLFDHDAKKTQVFVMADHFMDIMYDYHQVLRGKMIIVPKSFPVLQPGQVLHVTFEVDGFLTLNRVLGMFVAPASVSLNAPVAGKNLMSRGKMLDWTISGDYHKMYDCLNGRRYSVINSQGDRGNQYRWVHYWNGNGGGMNGDSRNLDFRHKFDLYISSTRYMILEEGTLMKDVDLRHIKKPNSTAIVDHTAKWLYNAPIQIGFYHYIYHSDADVTYLKNGLLTPLPTYWINNRFDSDERHWDNLGFEVLTSFPSI